MIWPVERFSITITITWRMTGRACAVRPHAAGAFAEVAAAACDGRAVAVAITASAPARAARPLIGREAIGPDRGGPEGPVRIR